MTSWVKIGAKCVCVDDDWMEEHPSFPRKPTRFPMINEILTVDGVMVSEKSMTVLLHFEELPERFGWEADSFKPFVSPTLEQDVEAIKRGLDPIAMADLLLDEMDAASR